MLKTTFFILIALLVSCTKKPNGNGEAVNGNRPLPVSFIALSSEHVQILKTGDSQIGIRIGEKAFEGTPNGTQVALASFQVSQQDLQGTSMQATFRDCRMVAAGEKTSFRFSSPSLDPVLILSMDQCPSFLAGEKHVVSLMTNEDGKPNYVIKTVVSFSDQKYLSILYSHWDGVNLSLFTNLGFFQSPDSGLTFQKLDQALTFPPGDIKCSHNRILFSISPETGETFRSLDNGITIEAGPQLPPPPDRTWGACHLNNGEITVWANLVFEDNTIKENEVFYYSKNAGMSFERFALPEHIQYVTDIVINQNFVSVGTFNGIYLSEDGGTTFPARSNPNGIFSDLSPTAEAEKVVPFQGDARKTGWARFAYLAVRPRPKSIYRNKNLILVATGASLLFSIDSGKTYSILDEAPLNIPNRSNHANTLLVTDSGIIFAVGTNRVTRIYGVK